MGTRDLTLTIATTDALEWARQGFDWHAYEVVADAPWAVTLRLKSPAGQAYLKILARQQSGMIESVARMASHFAGRLPTLLAHDAARGWMLSADHGGRMLDYDSAPEDVLALVRTYASMQVEAARTPALGAGLPQIAVQTLTAQLMQFLAPASRTDGPAGDGVDAAYFVGSTDAARYHRLLQSRLGVIDRHLAPAALLPLTINHGDMRPPNAAVGTDGGCIVMDWDDAIIGPAGMSLQGLFDGATVPTILLSGSKAAEAAADTPDGQRIRAYLEALAEGGYADVQTLRMALPAAICAGLIQFILNFGKYPGESGRSGVGETLRGRFSNLLDLCDLLVARDPAQAVEFAQNYEDQGEFRRARHLLLDQVARHPGDVPALVRLGHICRLAGEHVQALEALREAIDLTPGEAALHAELGTTLLEMVDLDGAERALLAALDIDADLLLAREDLERTRDLRRQREEAAQTGRMPVLRYDPHDTLRARPRPEQVALGAELFDTHGTLQIDNAFPTETILRLQEAFFERYRPYFTEGDHANALLLSDKRYMLTVDMLSPFDDPQLIGAPTLLPILRRLLGDHFVLGAFTAVISLPGSPDQDLHKDHPALFPDSEWQYTLPCFAVQITIPLVPLDEFSGTTRVFKGTHRIPTDEAEAAGYQDPVVPLGSCLMTDYRCAHRGLGNRSERVRPILTLIYNRPWFRDFKNYNKQPPLRLPDATYTGLPAGAKTLVNWWKQERMVDSLDHARMV